MKHTPGPWILEEDPDGIPWDKVKVSSNGYITVEGRTSGEAQANAQLIAAAPEMHDLLVYIKEKDCSLDVHHMICKLLKEIEGETK